MLRHPPSAGGFSSPVFVQLLLLHEKANHEFQCRPRLQLPQNTSGRWQRVCPVLNELERILPASGSGRLRRTTESSRSTGGGLALSALESVFLRNPARWAGLSTGAPLALGNGAGGSGRGVRDGFLREERAGSLVEQAHVVQIRNRGNDARWSWLSRHSSFRPENSGFLSEGERHFGRKKAQKAQKLRGIRSSSF
jgi:hypothetical protein